MKGLKRTICVATTLLPMISHAELTLIGDDELRLATGQAGMTIDVNAQDIKIGAIDYQDQGFLSMKQIAITGGDLVSPMDNLRITFDVAGDGSDLGSTSLGSGQILADGGTVLNLVEDDQNAQISEGDLIVSLRPIDASQALDFGMTVESIELGASTNAAGSVSGGTVLFSNLEVSGNLGPLDIVIDGSNGEFNLNMFFNAEGKIEVPFHATSLDWRIHNSRGNSIVTVGSESYAHFQLEVRSAVNSDGNTALGLDLQDLSGDFDMTNIQLGDNGISFGDLYLTDLQITAETVIYGH